MVIVKKPLDIMPTVDLLPSHIYLTAAEMQLVSKAARETVLKKYIERHIEFFSRYDYIIFDTAPSLSIVNQNAFVVADSILLVSDISINGLKGSTKFISEWNNICEDLNIEKNIKGMLINKYDKRTKLSKEVAEYVREHELLKELSFDVIVPENIKLKETEMLHSPIAYYDVKNAGYEAYVDLVKELKKRSIL
jgi:chromosome partitioning protein